MSGHLSIRDRWRIISLHFDQNMTPNRIASIVNCTSRTVFNILQLFNETEDVVERQGHGRNLLNEEHTRTLRQLFYRHATETAFTIRNRFFEIINILLTSRTIRNYRRRYNFRP